MLKFHLGQASDTEMCRYSTEITCDNGQHATVVWAWSETEQCAYILEAWDTETGYEIPIMSFSDHDVAQFADLVAALDPFPPYDFSF